MNSHSLQQEGRAMTPMSIPIADEAIRWHTLLRNSPVPSRLHEGIALYLSARIPPGSFLRAVLENDLRTACGRADQVSVAALPAIVRFLFQHAPLTSWGSLELVQAWLKGEGQS